MNKIFKFGWRPVLFMGADRELTLITAFTCVIVAVYSFSLIIVATSTLIWIVIVHFFRLMAKSDPLMRHVYVRHVKYNISYLAKSTFFCKSQRIYK